MIRLVLLLCGGLLAAMLIGGRDHGQVRFGLVVAAQASPEPRAAVVAAPIIKAQPAPEATVVAADAAPFTPATPVMVTEVSATSADAANATDAAAEPAGEPMQINASSLKVRVKPGKNFTVIARLPRDARVLLIKHDEENEGWSLIRIEKGGMRGYVQTQYLR